MRVNPTRMEDIRRVMQDVGWISAKDLADEMHVNVETIRYYLNMLSKAGSVEVRDEVVEHVDSKASSRRFIYRLKDAFDAAPVPPTPPAYRNLRLTENLTDYGRANREFAALCMMMRK